MRTLLFSLVLVGCGDITVNDPQVAVNTQPLKKTEPAVTSNGWLEAELDAERQRCQTKTIEIEGVTTGQAAKYCACLIAAVSTKWTKAEVEADVDAVIRALKKEGTYDNCDKEAGIPSRAAADQDEEETTKDEVQDPKLLVKGMTKTEVVEITGMPHTITNTGINTEFTWAEDPKFARMCGNPYGYQYVNLQCSLVFDSQGLLIGQKDIKPRWLDIESF